MPDEEYKVYDPKKYNLKIVNFLFESKLARIIDGKVVITIVDDIEAEEPTTANVELDQFTVLTVPGLRSFVQNISPESPAVLKLRKLIKENESYGINTEPLRVQLEKVIATEAAEKAVK